MLSKNISNPTFFIFYIIIIFIIFLKIKNDNKFLKVCFLLLIIFICDYNDILGLLFFIVYILIFTNNNLINETFSSKDNHVQDLNLVLQSLKQKKSKQILETMFSL